MLYNSKTSLVPSVVREFGMLLLVVLFASTPFFAAQAGKAQPSRHQLQAWATDFAPRG